MSTMSLTATDGNRVITEIRPGDGYVDATKLCKSAGKEWKHYFENRWTKSFLVELSASVGSPTVDKSHVRNGGRHTWVYHQVALHLAMWCSPKSAVAVTLVDQSISVRHLYMNGSKSILRFLL